MAVASTVSGPRAQIPNALTLARLAAVPAYAALILDLRARLQLAGRLVFGLAGVTDQIDGFLARRWHVESAFGKIADPLADRLLIDVAVLLLWHAGRLPWAALVDPGAGPVRRWRATPLLLGRGYRFEVNLLGKLATWLLYRASGFVMVVHRGWPLPIFWTGLALALALAAPLRRARPGGRRSRRRRGGPARPAALGSREEALPRAPGGGGDGAGVGNSV